MTWITILENAPEQIPRTIGGKAAALAFLARNGFTIPRTLCVTADSYDYFITRTGLRERILLELSRKDFKEMRWEEIWDASLRIRGMFLKEALPEDISSQLHETLSAWHSSKAVVVRSSASDEDASATSFAGLHESYVNIRGVESIVEHIKLVWASLWSDAALLYRQEIGLDVAKSRMAVIVQELIEGHSSGVVFSSNPTDPSQLVIESIYGLNQGLVDGLLEPDRWFLDRTSLKILSHAAARRDKILVAIEPGTQVKPLSKEKASQPPLTNEDVLRISTMALEAEKVFGRPQDMEWTIRDGKLIVLQSRPVTTLEPSQGEDKRTWYLSLRRSFENLRHLREKIEHHLIPAMVREAAQMAGQDLKTLSDEELEKEVCRRKAIESKWNTIYWEEYIPFAHGVRLFGQFYNDTVRPTDPYEFVRLLGATEMESLARNRMLEEMASMVRSDRRLKEQLVSGEHLSADQSFLNLLHRFIEQFGDLSCPITGVVQCSQAPEGVLRLVLEMAAHPPTQLSANSKEVESLKAAFLNRFSDEKRLFAEEILDLARASYRLRDDDNIKLARIEAQKLAAIQEAESRIMEKGLSKVAPGLVDEISAGARIPLTPQIKTTRNQEMGVERVRPRQLRGQPAGPGIARGPARIIRGAGDLLAFKHGEVLVCDAVDPNMTFVVPLAAAIVERRGGMLIHGAIIAREYGLPCVTGLSGAAELIKTGDLVTVDGFLGIVTIGTAEL